MKDWEKRRDHASELFSNCRNGKFSSANSVEHCRSLEGFRQGFTEGRTDSLSELSFVRETLIKISKDRCVHVSGEATNIPTWSADEANKAMEKLDALIKNN